jgi:hypothetical protein
MSMAVIEGFLGASCIMTGEYKTIMSGATAESRVSVASDFLGGDQADLMGRSARDAFVLSFVHAATFPFGQFKKPPFRLKFAQPPLLVQSSKETSMMSHAV